MGTLILACFKHRGGTMYTESEFISVLDIPCKKLDDGRDDEPQPLRNHLPNNKKVYLFVNVASN